MSLIGSLEDLSLGDILQIISLSQKSGVLLINTSATEGRITFHGGLVRAAVVKGGPEDFRSLLVDGGFLAEEDYRTALMAAGDDPAAFERELAQQGSLSAERLDSLRREAVESAVVEMFGWTSGEFSFDVGAGDDLGVEKLALPTGINAQYLAMEGARVSDESDRDEGGSASDAVSDAERDAVLASADAAFSEETYAVAAETDAAAESSGEPSGSEPMLEAESVLDGVPLAEADEHATDALLEPEPAEMLPADEPGDERERPPEPVAELQPLEEAAVVDEPSPVDAEPLEDPSGHSGVLGEAVDHVALATAARVDASPDPVPALSPSPPAAVVVVDPDLRTAEWVKEALRERYEPIHIFQRPDLGLNRIRQYLARAQQPLVLLSPEIEGDRISGIRDARDFAVRLKKQSSRMCVLWVTEHGVSAPSGADGTVLRPASSVLRNPRSADEVDTWGGQFGERLEEERRRLHARAHGAATRGPAGGESIGWLKQATEALRAASERGEVLPLVVEIASRTFTRVALFAVRETQILGIAQHGLADAGGPDDGGLGAIGLSTGDSILFDRVLEQRAPVRMGPDGPGDPILGALLGDTPASECYAAPVESAGQIVALLYGDNLPGGAPIGDTGALEVVLHHAGLALDRAVLERALAAMEGEEPA